MEAAELLNLIILETIEVESESNQKISNKKFNSPHHLQLKNDKNFAIFYLFISRK